MQKTVMFCCPKDNSCRHNIRAWRCLLIAAWLVLPISAAVDATIDATVDAAVFWDANGTDPPSGVFSVDANWDPDGVPTESDAAAFALDAVYTVTFDNSPTTTALEVSAGDVSFSSSGDPQTYSLTENAFVDDATLTLDNIFVESTADLTVADAGTAGLFVGNGAQLANSRTYVGYAADSHGSATVDGTDSTWNLSADLYIGREGNGELTVRAGGQVSNDYAYLAYSGTGSYGAVTVEGLGSAWSNSGRLYVGREGTGELTVSDGAEVSNTSAYLGYSGEQPRGIVTVQGTDSAWNNGSHLYMGLGSEGTGELTVSDGAEVSNASAYLGYAGVDCRGTATVQGTGSAWNNTGHLHVGYRGDGELTIQDGGYVSNTTYAYLGRYAGSDGSATVEDEGSIWECSNTLFVGYAGNAELAISAGGYVSSRVGIVAADNAIEGSATIDGPGSAWVISEDLTIGYDGTGRLAVTAGGRVSNAEGYLGSGSQGTATVDGQGSLWHNAGALYVGYESGSGALTVSGGGEVSSTDGYLGHSWSAAEGTVTVQDRGSTWSNSGSLYVGGNDEAAQGTGLLAVRNGGRVNVTETLVVWETGTLEFGLGHTHQGTPDTVASALDVAGQPSLEVDGDVTLHEGSTLTLSVGSRLIGPTGNRIHGDLTQTILTAAGSRGVIGTFTHTPQVGDYYADPPTLGDYLGNGVWFGHSKTGQGVIYVGAPDTVTAVDVAVFQAKPGDSNGDRSISFADFNDLANNYTGALASGVGGKEWRQGDFNGDADVDFGDFNDLANNYTGAGVEYAPPAPAAGPKSAPGGRGSLPAPDAAAAGTPTPGNASLIVYLADATDADGVFHAAGDVLLSVDAGVEESSLRINGYEVSSAGGLLIPDAAAVPYPLVGGAYMEKSSAGIVAFSGLTSPLVASGDQGWTLGWKYDVHTKAAGDLEFYYGTSAGVIPGNVLYVVPEPGTLLLLLCGILGLLPLRVQVALCNSQAATG